MAVRDWNPESYARFGDLRLRPALDLLARVGALPAGEVIDLGCGNGAAGPALRERFGANRRITGLDASPAMLEAAGRGGSYTALVEGDAEGDAHDQPWRSRRLPVLARMTLAVCSGLVPPPSTVRTRM